MPADILGTLVVTEDEKGRKGFEFQQGPRVDADLTVDDELQPSQAHTRVRQTREGERLVGGADVHHHLDGGRRHPIELGLLLGELQEPVVHETVITLGARDGHLLAVFQGMGGHAGADDGGDAE